MSVLDRIAFYQNRRDEVPNQELARELAASGDRAGIQVIADNLSNKNKSVRSDCLKVLYEIGYIHPDLIAYHVAGLLALLSSKDNRMVWGAMIGLATIADQRAEDIWRQNDDVIRAVDKGSVITVVWGIRTLARVAGADSAYRRKLFPILLRQLQTCIPRDVPTHAESMLPAVDAENQQEFLAVLQARQGELSASQAARLHRVTRRFAPP
jgi:hypothetical protein